MQEYLRINQKYEYQPTSQNGCKNLRKRCHPGPRDESNTTEYAEGDALPIVFHGAARPVLTAT